jgi:hypoxanthine phosphoribosyltransferase
MADKLRLIVSQAEIASRIRELAVEIRAAYEGEDLLVLGVLDDCFVFLADLIREVNVPLACSFIHTTTHQSGGHTDIAYTSDTEVTGRHILVVSGVLDTGVTFNYIIQQITGRGAASVRSCVLVDKPDFRTTEASVDFVGFKRSEEMIFGYGLGLRDNYRHLPFLAVFEQQEE